MKPWFSLFLIFTFLSIPYIHAQQQFNLGLEVGGKVLLFGSLSLESYWEKSQIGLGIGTGFTNYESRTAVFFDSTLQMPIEGQFTAFTFPGTLYAYKTFGKKKNRLILPFGLSAQMQVERNELEGDRWVLEEFAPLPFVGLGYELHGDRVIFRLPAYVLYIGSDSDPEFIFPDFLPWLGLGFVWRL